MSNHDSTVRLAGTAAAAGAASPIDPRAGIPRLLCAYVAESLRITERWAAENGINHTDLRAMALLDVASRNGRSLSAGELGDALALSSPATSALIARLERGGQIVRERDPLDRRRVRLTASPSSCSEAAGSFAAMGDAVRSALGGCSSDEAAFIAAFLERLVRHMRVVSPGQPEDSSATGRQTA